jgi:hypothetical protein
MPSGMLFWKRVSTRGGKAWYLPVFDGWLRVAASPACPHCPAPGLVCVLLRKPTSSRILSSAQSAPTVVL